MGERREKEANKEADAQINSLLDVRSDIAETPDKYRTMDPEVFRREWRERVSDSGFKQISHAVAQTKKEKPGSSTEFNRFATAQANGNAATNGKSEQSKPLRKEYLSRMDIARRAFKLKNKGQEPTSLDELEE